MWVGLKMITPPAVVGVATLRRLAMREDPLVIVGLDGSGSDMVAGLAKAGGVFMGDDVDESISSGPIQTFYDKWLHVYVSKNGQFNPADSAQIDEDFHDRLKAHHPRLPSALVTWGVKLPGSIPMLSYWRQSYPAFRMIHVVRNGLDMACSSDVGRVRMAGDLILGEQERQADESTQAMLYWSRVNGATAQFGELVLRARYLRIRLEDLCADSGTVIKALAGFVREIDANQLLCLAGDLITPPATLGHWRGQSSEVIERLVALGGSTLKRFSYVDE